MLCSGSTETESFIVSVFSSYYSIFYMYLPRCGTPVSCCTQGSCIYFFTGKYCMSTGLLRGRRFAALQQIACVSFVGMLFIAKVTIHRSFQCFVKSRAVSFRASPAAPNSFSCKRRNIPLETCKEKTRAASAAVSS